MTDTKQENEGRRIGAPFMWVSAAVFAAILALSILAYRQLYYVPLFQGLNSDEAVPILEQLKERELNYQVKDDGKTISVKASQADELRLEFSGHTGASKYLVGFELFDESEMGLTEFAHKVKYQRALEGELSRSIMTTPGIRSARVHLSIPERALFQNNAQKPRASVLVVPKHGNKLTHAQVEGIQRFISQSVSELSMTRVVVLNQSLEIISAPSEVLFLEDEKEVYALIEEEYGASQNDITVPFKNDGELVLASFSKDHSSSKDLVEADDAVIEVNQKSDLEAERLTQNVLFESTQSINGEKGAENSLRPNSSVLPDHSNDRWWLFAIIAVLSAVIVSLIYQLKRRSEPADGSLIEFAKLMEASFGSEVHGEKEPVRE